jgi:hypothetical protein
VLHSLRRVSQDSSGPCRFAVDVHECRALDAVATLPLDGEVRICLFDMDGFRVPVPRELRGKPILFIEQPDDRSPAMRWALSCRSIPAAALAARPLQHRSRPAHPAGVRHQQQPRVEQQRTGKRHSLRHAAGKLVRVFLLEALETNELDQDHLCALAPPPQVVNDLTDLTVPTREELLNRTSNRPRRDICVAAFGPPTREDRVRNRFRRPDGRVADSSRNPLSTRSLWRATGIDGVGFAVVRSLPPREHPSSSD